jgi:hypothetical protein
VLLEPQKTQGREGMTRHHRTISIVVFVALLVAVTPSVASANSLLSGYGGPGEGNQAILGSALVNTPKGGGGAGGSNGGQVSNSAPGESASPQSAGSAPSRTGGASGAGKSTSGGRSKERAAARKRRDRGATRRTAGGGAVIYPAASSEVATGGSRTLGLSGADFAYIILALGVLALTGFLTMRLARRTVARGPDGRSS